MTSPASNNEAANCATCARKGRNFLRCSRCDRKYHPQCLSDNELPREGAWICPQHSCSTCRHVTPYFNSAAAVEYVERAGSQCLACFRRFCPAHLDQAKSVTLSLETYGKHLSGVNDIIICHDCTQNKDAQNQPNKRRRLDSGESIALFTSAYAEQSPRESESDSHSQSSPRDYKIIFSNYSFAASTSAKETVPEPPRKNIKLKFKDCLEFTEEPIRPQADENLIALLREVMRTTKKNQKIVANEIGVSPTTMSSYMNSKGKPTGWNKMERKLKLWITNLEVELPAPRESAIPSESHPASAESKEEASESGSPIDTRSSWDYSECTIEDNRAKSFATQCCSPYVEQQYEHPISSYKSETFQFSQESYIDLQSQQSPEHGFYGQYPPLDQSAVSYAHPFASPSTHELDHQSQASFWPPLNLTLSFDHTQSSY